MDTGVPQEKGASTTFKAEPGTTPLTNWLSLYHAEPHIYRVSADTCESSSATVEIRCYPAGEVSHKFAFTELKDKIHKALAMAPLGEKEKTELEKEFFQGLYFKLTGSLTLTVNIAFKYWGRHAKVPVCRTRPEMGG